MINSENNHFCTASSRELHFCLEFQSQIGHTYLIFNDELTQEQNRSPSLLYRVWNVTAHASSVPNMNTIFDNSNDVAQTCTEQFLKFAGNARKVTKLWTIFTRNPILWRGYTETAASLRFKLRNDAYFPEYASYKYKIPLI